MLTRLLALFCCYLAIGLSTARADATSANINKHVDAEIYKGYTLYRNWCARCHGTFGQGLAGPDLTQSLKKISYEEFIQVVTKGKNGRIGVMPAWQSNSSVMAGQLAIYSYLKARSDGLIDAVKPEKKN